MMIAEIVVKAFCNSQCNAGAGTSEQNVQANAGTSERSEQSNAGVSKRSELLLTGTD
jgi:hypothetical protein